MSQIDSLFQSNIDLRIMTRTLHERSPDAFQVNLVISCIERLYLSIRIPSSFLCCVASRVRFAEYPGRPEDPSNPLKCKTQNHFAPSGLRENKPQLSQVLEKKLVKVDWIADNAGILRFLAS